MNRHFNYIKNSLKLLLIALSVFFLLLFQNCGSSASFSTESLVENPNQITSDLNTNPSNGSSSNTSSSIEVKKTNFLFILSGQSNSWGLGRIADLSKPEYSFWQRYRTFEFKNLNFSFFEQLQWRIDLNPSPVLNKLVQRKKNIQSSLNEKFGEQHEWNNSTSNFFDSEFGAEIGLSYYLREKPNLEVYKQAYPGYPISSFLESYLEEGVVKNNGGNFIRSVLANLENTIQSNDLTDIFFVWHQGESDSVPSKSLDYDKNLESLLAIVKQRIKGKFPQVNLWNIIVSIHAQPPTNSTAFPIKNWNEVRARQQSVVLKSDGFSVYLRTDSLPLDADEIHINAEGQLALGECIGNLSNILSQKSIAVPVNERLFQCRVSQGNSEKTGALLAAPKLY